MLTDPICSVLGSEYFTRFSDSNKLIIAPGHTVKIHIIGETFSPVYPISGCEDAGTDSDKYAPIPGDAVEGFIMGIYQGPTCPVAGSENIAIPYGKILVAVKDYLLKVGERALDHSPVRFNCICWLKKQKQAD